MKRSIIVRALAAALLLAGLATRPAAAQDWAKARLDHSPRHQEWVKLKVGNRQVDSFVVYPEVHNRATAVVLVHEIFGLSDWMRGVADQLAEHGYIAIAPDLLSGMGPHGGGTSDFPDRDAVTRAVFNLQPEGVTAALNAAAAYVGHLPAANGKVAVAGFCWGGGQAFALPTTNHNLKAAYVFYGTPPDSDAALANIRCPIYGFYAGNDARVSSTVGSTEQRMAKLHKKYQAVGYAGAGHGFMRAGEQPDASPDNKRAHDEAWKRWLNLLKRV